MWPWEHLLFGYLVYSLICHVHFRDAPGGPEALLVGVAAVLPDLIDKPLAWQFDIVTTGYAMAHSLFIAVPMAMLVLFVARRHGEAQLGLAVAIGHLSHLAGDIIMVYIYHGSLTVERHLWPVVIYRTRDYGGLVDGFLTWFGPYLTRLLSEPGPYVWVQVAIALAAVGLWLYDGAPGPGTISAWLRRPVTTDAS